MLFAPLALVTACGPMDDEADELDESLTTESALSAPMPALVGTLQLANQAGGCASARPDNGVEIADCGDGARWTIYQGSDGNYLVCKPSSARYVTNYHGYDAYLADCIVPDVFDSERLARVDATMLSYRFRGSSQFTVARGAFTYSKNRIGSRLSKKYLTKSSTGAVAYHDKSGAPNQLWTTR